MRAPLKTQVLKVNCMEKERSKCEIYSRVVGYLRPVDQWNEGKQAEFLQRKTYQVPA